MLNCFLLSTLLLGAASVPTDVYLLVGQSNMAGRGVLTPSNRVDTTRVLKWNCWQAKPDGNAWTEAVEPIVRDRDYSGAGPGASFARAMADANPDAVVGLVPAAEGGSPLARWMPGKDLYERALRWTRAALAEGGTLKGILWHQGCSDSRSPETATNYAARLSVVVAALRKDLNAPDVPFVAGELGSYLDTYRDREGQELLPQWRTVNEQLGQAMGLIPNMRLVRADGLVHKGDNLHFSTESARTLGRRYAAAFLAPTPVNPWTIRRELIAPMMPRQQETLSSTCIYNEVVEKDVAADLAWTQISTPAAYDAKRAELRTRLLEAMGGLPERTPLNAKTTGVVQRDGYRIEKIVFESQPGLYVTANFFIPDGPGPFPGVVHACGHSDPGKGYGYQRPGVKGAKAGFATLVFDPIDQGERRQEPSYSSMRFPYGLHYAMGHNQIGIRAMLLGWSVSRFMVWDAMRAIDYVQSRTDVVRPGKVGYLGTSGGGTSTGFMMALDDRIGAAAPSCFMTSFRALLNGMAPQDAEQQVFGELSFGLNHLGLFVMGNVPGAVTSGHVDGFPHYGTWESFAIAQALAGRLGKKDFYDQIGMPGGHGWSEGTLDAAFAWIASWLCDRPELRPLDMGKYRFVNHHPAGEKESLDEGLSLEGSCAVPGGWVGNLPGATDAFAMMQTRLEGFEKTRRTLSKAERSALVRRVAKVRLPGERKTYEKTLSTASFGGMTVEKHVFAYADGLTLPAVLMVPDVIRGAPAVAFASGAQIEWGRVSTAPHVGKLLAAGRPVLSIDLTACGEIGKPKHYFYGTDLTEHSEESAGVMLYMLGDSLVGRRASDILLAADFMKRRFGSAVTLHATGTTCIAAAHAYAAAPELVSSVEDLVEPPPAWADLVRTPLTLAYYSDCVNGALEHYDWTELVESRK